MVSFFQPFPWVCPKAHYDILTEPVNIADWLDAYQTNPLSSKHYQKTFGPLYQLLD